MSSIHGISSAALSFATTLFAGDPKAVAYHKKKGLKYIPMRIAGFGYDNGVLCAKVQWIGHSRDQATNEPLRYVLACGLIDMVEEAVEREVIRVKGEFDEDEYDRRLVNYLEHLDEGLQSWNGQVKGTLFGFEAWVDSQVKNGAFSRDEAKLGDDPLRYAVMAFSSVRKRRLGLAGGAINHYIRFHAKWKDAHPLSIHDDLLLAHRISVAIRNVLKDAPGNDVDASKEALWVEVPRSDHQVRVPPPDVTISLTAADRPTYTTRTPIVLDYAGILQDFSARLVALGQELPSIVNHVRTMQSQLLRLGRGTPCKASSTLNLAYVLERLCHASQLLRWAEASHASPAFSSIKEMYVEAMWWLAVQSYCNEPTVALICMLSMLERIGSEIVGFPGGVMGDLYADLTDIILASALALHRYLRAPMPSGIPYDIRAAAVRSKILDAFGHACSVADCQVVVQYPILDNKKQKRKRGRMDYSTRAVSSREGSNLWIGYKSVTDEKIGLRNKPLYPCPSIVVDRFPSPALICFILTIAEPAHSRCKTRSAKPNTGRNEYTHVIVPTAQRTVQLTEEEAGDDEGEDEEEEEEEEA